MHHEKSSYQVIWMFEKVSNLILNSAFSFLQNTNSLQRRKLIQICISFEMLFMEPSYPELPKSSGSVFQLWTHKKNSTNTHRAADSVLGVTQQEQPEKNETRFFSLWVFFFPFQISLLFWRQEFRFGVPGQTHAHVRASAPHREASPPLPARGPAAGPGLPVCPCPAPGSGGGGRGCWGGTAELEGRGRPLRSSRAPLQRNSQHSPLRGIVALSQPWHQIMSTQMVSPIARTSSYYFNHLHFANAYGPSENTSLIARW